MSILFIALSLFPSTAPSTEQLLFYCFQLPSYSIVLTFFQGG